MAGMASALPSALLPGPREDNEAESLKSILARIYDERGHFRHMTEESLQAEIAADEAQENSSDTEEEEDEVVEIEHADAKSRREQLYAARAEMLAHVASAQNEALMGLDFISLLISKDAPKQAELTMSPHLKQFVKPGTLGLDMWNNMAVDREMQKTDDAISRGWRMDSLQTCANSLLDAASRLEKSVRRETRYWEHILSVSERGWSISRMPRERHNLGVRFGFLEALGEYRDRGLAALRADDSGNVILDKGFGNNSKSIRIRVQLGSRSVGVSKLSHTPAESDITLETRIRAARDSLYEEELFHEMIRESRSLASYGVDMHQSTIRLPTSLDSRGLESTGAAFDSILIDLVSPEEVGDEEAVNLPQDQAAQVVAVAFRLLLSYVHRERLKRRSDAPRPMSLSRQDRPVAPILRPVLSILQHQSVSRCLDCHLERLGALLGRACIEASVKAATMTAEQGTLLSKAESIEVLMEKMFAPIHSRSSLSIRIPGRTDTLDFTVHVETGSSAGTLGSRIRLESPVGLGSIEFTESDDLVDYLDAMMGSALGREVAAALPGWRYSDRLKAASRADRRGSVSVTVQSGMAGDDEGGHVMLDTGGAKLIWRSGGKGQHEGRLWDAVGDIK